VIITISPLWVLLSVPNTLPSGVLASKSNIYWCRCSPLGPLSFISIVPPIWRVVFLGGQRP
jgi:hypothetical protein